MQASDFKVFTPTKNAVALVGWLLLTFSAAMLGLTAEPGLWYEHLDKPAWTPPSWIFGPVWTTLYLLMAVAAWLVWREGGWKKQALPLGLYLLQWALNAIWTPIFFGMQRPGWAMADIVLLWIAIGATIVTFWRVHRGAAALLMPYWAWVTFAAVLNFAIWRMNA